MSNDFAPQIIVRVGTLPCCHHKATRTRCLRRAKRVQRVRYLPVRTRCLRRAKRVQRVRYLPVRLEKRVQRVMSYSVITMTRLLTTSF